MKTTYWIAGGIVAAAALWALLARPKDTGAALAGAAWSLADGIVGEVGNLAGEAIGIPRTNMTQCELDKARGDNWAASFSCPAGDFISWWWNK